MKVAVGVEEGVKVRLAVNVAVRLGVKVEVGVNDGMGVREMKGVRVGDAAGVAVGVDIPGVRVGVATPGVGVATPGVGVAAPGVGVRVAVTESSGVGDPDGSAVGLAPEGVGLAPGGVDVADGAWVGTAVDVIGAEGGSLKQAIPGSASRAIDQANRQDE